MREGIIDSNITLTKLLVRSNVSKCMVIDAKKLPNLSTKIIGSLFNIRKHIMQIVCAIKCDGIIDEREIHLLYLQLLMISFTNKIVVSLII